MPQTTTEQKGQHPHALLTSSPTNCKQKPTISQLGGWLEFNGTFNTIYVSLNGLVGYVVGWFIHTQIKTVEE